MAEKLAHPSDEGSKVRKERVHTTMLIELLVTLVFLAMAYAFVEKDQMHFDTVKQELKETREKLIAAESLNERLKHENIELRREREVLQRRIMRLLGISKSVIPNGGIPITQVEAGALQKENENLRAMLDETRKENIRLRDGLAKSRGKSGGSDLPNCPVTAGYLLRIDLYEGDIYRVTAAWKIGAQGISEIPKLNELAAGEDMSASQFAELSDQVAGWGIHQAIPCRFRVNVYDHHSDLGLYKQQVGVIERFFYDKRN